MSEKTHDLNRGMKANAKNINNSRGIITIC